MKLICTQENFKRAIYNSERVVSKQNTLPILNNILFETSKGGLKMSATNLEIGVEVKIAAKIEKEGKITIPAKLISSFINNIPPGENISLELVDQNMKIKCGNHKAVIKGLLADEFPLIPQKTTDYILELPAEKLRIIISKIISCAAANEARQELTGINMILGVNEVSFAATDSFRLAENILKINDKEINKNQMESVIEKNNNLIIPSNTMSELLRVISFTDEQSVKIAIEDGQIFFDVDGTKLVSRLINGKYPDYKNIIPKEFKTSVFVAKEEFQGAVKMASFFSNNKTSEIIIGVDGKNSNVTIEAKSVDVGESSSFIKGEIKGEDQKLVLNARYLLDGINALIGEKIIIKINNESSPIALTEQEGGGEIEKKYIYILMPIKS
jgi:DNA polymerase III subunit beta